MTLIPFAKDKETGRLVAVEDVPAGRSCGCICPSCNAVLIARKGEVNEWHFAHDHHEYQKVDKECEFSFFVSVAMMAKQLLEDKCQLLLPDYIYTIHVPGEITNQQYKKSILITKSSTVKFDSCVVAASNADIVGYVGGIPVLLYLDYPGRGYLPFDLSEQSMRGVLIIDLQVWHDFYFDANNKTGVKQSLSDFLFDKATGKIWKYHPRQDQLIRRETEIFQTTVNQREHAQRDQERLEKEKARLTVLQTHNANPQSTFDDVTTFTGKADVVEFICHRCKVKWTAPTHGRQLCPKCYLPATWR